MELCIPRQWPSPCSTGLLVLGIVVLVSLPFGAAVALVVRRLCCQRRPVGHATEEDEEAAVEDWSNNKKFSTKFIWTFAVAAKQVPEQDDPKSIPPTMARSPGASPEPAWTQRLMLSSSQAVLPIISSSPPHVPSSQNPPTASSSSSSDPLSDFSPASQRSLKEFIYQSLEKATGGFDSRNELGRGESGVTYAGDLLFDNGLVEEVAIKLFHKNFVDDDSKQVLDDLTQKKRFLQHRNLVTLFGYCLHEGRLYLVYDRVHYNSLDYKLSAEEGAAASKPVLTLAQCYSIIRDVARGLYQLHKFQAFHGAVRASNVMLDPCTSGFRARLGDFRYSRLLVENVTTLGSLMLCQNPTAPEQALPSLETDMLHFGRMMLESLKKASDSDSVQADELLQLGLQCSDQDPKQRPTVEDVLVKLAEIEIAAEDN
ncbi:unnamed protein product [Urochloa humidicola]